MKMLDMSLIFLWLFRFLIIDCISSNLNSTNYNHIKSESDLHLPFIPSTLNNTLTLLFIIALISNKTILYTLHWFSIVIAFWGAVRSGKHARSHIGQKARMKKTALVIVKNSCNRPFKQFCFWSQINSSGHGRLNQVPATTTKVGDSNSTLAGHPGSKPPSAIARIVITPDLWKPHVIIWHCAFQSW